jgi:hypothetical protein
MLNATRHLILPTTVTGSWPRPSWFTEVLRGRAFICQVAAGHGRGDRRRRAFMLTILCAYGSSGSSVR